ncbi:restriction endonuclease [Corallococcus praedator]|uniref:Restriction endonuclease n=1 Tax=Corallococcus praedator TaxID=2316724 RepID=A0ABX9QHM5_9BACT|nr:MULTISPECIES: restriction endonuclease [Corallococcus]RKH10260.1 restriction endonuclease [Corallococcus sp. CA047B]RKH29206.1 restriction endonuclease [Corallococcus sp. CA031C]RKI06818.1 restriction endonuclease [Corallococcus praedator]
MSLPSYPRFIGPLLQYLGEQQGSVRPRVIYQGLADRLGLSEEERTVLLPSGAQSVFQNRIGWAHDALKRAGLSSAPVRGTWLITDAGRKFLAKHGGKVPEEEVERIAGASRDVAIRSLIGANGSERSAGSAEAVPSPEETRSPREEIEDAIGLIRASVARDLLEHIANQTPTEFETLVLDLLYALGYGTSRSALLRVGRSNDGGIDGIVSLDRLGLQKVYVQAKKWQGQVGSPQIQGFMGALQLQGADKGVLITSGTISGPARDAAKQARGSIVLVDGLRLTELMIEHGVGVSTEALHIPKIDTDYFEAG